MDGSYGSRPLVCFEVEKVIGISSDGSFQVQWAPTWVSKFHLVGCEHLIQEFLQQQAEKDDRHLQIVNQSSELCSQMSSLRNHQSHSPDVEYEGQVIGPVSGNDSGTLSGFDEVNSHKSNVNSNTFVSSTLLDGTPNANQYVRLEKDDFVLQNATSVDVKVEDPDDGNDGDEVILDHTSLAFNSQESFSMYPVSSIRTTPDNSPSSTSKHQQEKTNSKHFNGTNDLTLTKFNSDDKYVCSICQRELIDKHNLKIHVRVHSGERPFVCKYCGKGFSQNGNLKVHMRTHTGERPFTCNICGKSFARKFVLDQHINTHSVVKPYICDKCGKTFTRTSNLDRHRYHCSGSLLDS